MSTSTRSAEWRRKRGKLGHLRGVLPADDPRVVQAQRDLKAQGLAEHVRHVVDSAPTLTAEQRDRIAAILRGGGAVVSAPPVLTANSDSGVSNAESTGQTAVNNSGAR
jgi:hypothetical protein